MTFFQINVSGMVIYISRISDKNSYNYIILN